MHESIIISGNTKKEKYESLLPQINALMEGENDFIANISNLIASLKYGMNFLWIGIYFVKPSLHPASPRLTPAPSPGGEGRKERGERRGEQELVLGPFQGPVACTRIAFGRGVCGTTWKEKKTMIVNEVDKFPGHIVCNPDSKSEIVIPCFKKGEVFAVLDIDSDKRNDFDETDKIYLEQIVRIIEQLP